MFHECLNARRIVVTVFAALLVTVTGWQSANANKSQDAQIAALEAKVAYLLDREAIRDLVMEYGRSVDARDWTAHRNLYTDEVEVDYSSMPGAPGSMKLSRDQWVKQVETFFAAMTATQHITDVLSVVIEDNEAHAVTMLHAQHYKPNAFGEPIQRMIGTYDVWFIRTAQGWRISKIKPELEWNEGNYWIFLEGAKKH